jgi:hypothetical protein
MNPTKQDIHDRLASITDTAIITVDEFVSVYGNDDRRKFGTAKVEMGRADILANTYGLSVSKEEGNYTFTKDLSKFK